MSHTPDTIHPNSRESFYALDDLGQRQQEVYRVVCRLGRCTDREVMEALGSKDPNAARPRVTELVDQRWLVEVGDTKCPVTHRTVRVVRALSPVERRAKLDEDSGQQGRLL